MTIDEAIKHCEEIAMDKTNLAQTLWDSKEKARCEECAEEHNQLAQWLIELKMLKTEQQSSGSEIPNNCEMRDATLEERESIDKYIKSISKPTGVKFGALEQEPSDDCISRQAVLNTEYQVKIINDIEYVMLSEVQMKMRKLPSVKPQACEDAVSRKALISHIEKQSREWGEDYDAQQILGDIEDMPSVKPQEPTGHWIEEINDYGEVTGWHCDKCYADSGFTTDCKWDYCPNCGAKMVEPQEGANECQI